MGRIKPLMVKKAAAELFEKVEGFGEDFETNKKLLKNTMHSKLVRNRVAGGIVRLAKNQRLKATEKKKEKIEEAESGRDDGQY
jgi:ribosomal protein S17E